MTYLGSSGVHYVGDDVFGLGSLCCAVCGHQFPLHTSAAANSVCYNCGLVHSPTAPLHLRSRSTAAAAAAAPAAAYFFSKDDIAEAVRCVAAFQRGGVEGGEEGEDGVVRVGETAVDNRVLEEAFCEKCATHRVCKTFARQTRSADEGQTIFFQCTVCHAEWQQNS